jgi:hypothetical protein
MKTKKTLVVGIIFLFIGIAVAPSINFTVVKASNDNDLVEVTTQACGIKGFGNTTVKLTRQQYQNLEQYLVDFRGRLNQTTTREEAIPIFKEAVVELNKYGLLPKGMSVEQAQRLVTTGHRIQNVANIIKKFTKDYINSFCLFTAIISDSVNWNIWFLIAWMIIYPYESYPFPEPPLLVLLLVDLFAYFSYMKPLQFDFIIELQGPVISYFSIGLGGIKKGGDNINGVVGFTGLKIILNSHDSFYLGFAFLVT